MAPQASVSWTSNGIPPQTPLEILLWTPLRIPLQTLSGSPFGGRPCTVTREPFRKPATSMSPSCWSWKKTQKNFYLLSLGLGLGYNEILSCAYSLRNPKRQMYLETYESHPLLGRGFFSFFSSFANFSRALPPKKESSPPKGSPFPPPSPPVETSLYPLYRKVLQLFARAFQLETRELFEWVGHCMNSEKLVLRGAIHRDSRPGMKFHGIFFDAFSSKTNPSLWTEEFLDDFLKTHCGEDCFFSSYAATGPLKRALEKK